MRLWLDHVPEIPLLAFFKDFSQHIRIVQVLGERNGLAPQPCELHLVVPDLNRQRAAGVFGSRGSKITGRSSPVPSGSTTGITPIAHHLHGHDAAKGASASRVLAAHKADILLARDSPRASLANGNGGGEGEVGFPAGLFAAERWLVTGHNGIRK